MLVDPTKMIPEHIVEEPLAAFEDGPQFFIHGLAVGIMSGYQCDTSVFRG